ALGVLDELPDRLLERRPPLLREAELPFPRTHGPPLHPRNRQCTRTDGTSHARVRGLRASAPVSYRSPATAAVCIAISRSSSVGTTSTSTRLPGAEMRRVAPFGSAFAASSTSTPRNSSPASVRARVGTLIPPTPAVNTLTATPPSATAYAPR